MTDKPDQEVISISTRLYQPNLKVVPSEISKLLASYSSIPEDAQKDHITKIRNQAYEKYPYPCLGRWRFLDLDLSIHPLYASDVLPALLPQKSDPIESTKQNEWLFLDLGCCLGQDIRKLIFDGADVSRLRGADLRPEFIDIGYELFGDRKTFPPSHFVTPADVFDFSPSAPLAKLDGQIGILHVCAVFHLFDLAEQKILAQRVLKLLSRNKKSVLVLGAQTANINAGEYERRLGDGRPRYRHNDASWRAFWEEAIAGDEWKGVIQGVDVGSVLELRTSGLGSSIPAEDSNRDSANNTQRQIGLFEEGFRWMKWWVRVEFV